jgi:hypothetical protein
MTGPTKAMKYALCVAAHRPRGTLCPVLSGKGRVHAAAEDRLLEGLKRRGLIDYNGPIPIINEAGLAVANTVFATLATSPRI